MPIPYADLVVSSIAVPQPAGSGQPLNVTWTVKNQGIGLTSVPSWDDDLALASDPAGKNIVADYGLFNHLGPDRPRRDYTRTAQITLPDGLSGTYYFVVTAAANNPPYRVHLRQRHRQHHGLAAVHDQPDAAARPGRHRASAPRPPPRRGAPSRWAGRCRTSAPAPPAATGRTRSSWRQSTSQPATPYLVVGTFDIFSGLAPGKSYSLTEAVTLPVHISGLYNVEVIANADGSLFENGATANNTGVASPSMTVTVMPRPDLQVAAIDIPSQINAGGSFAVTYTDHQPGQRPHDRSTGTTRSTCR